MFQDGIIFATVFGRIRRGMFFDPMPFMKNGRCPSPLAEHTERRLYDTLSLSRLSQPEKR
ncbi:hypothetical protein DESC_720443 [Desulfosarcina cetonica]|nr:hypothetical protein DESC_720443 [Desulfosarcina cetonica]